MRKNRERILSFILVLTMTVSLMLVASVGVSAASSGITEASGWLESAYVEWSDIDGASGYKAYVKSAGSSSWTRLDDQLIRKYKNYWRADAVGLKAGDYQMKIVPVIGGSDAESKALVTDTLKVLSHDRSGFAFVNGTSSGAYNDDGTLKSGAVVVYVTEQNKNSVTATIDGNTYTGISNILAQSVIKKTKTPICVRFIGNVTDLGEGTAFDKGDLLLSEGASGITLEGIGEDTVLNGFGIRIKRCSNVEIRNLATMNCDSNEGDNIGLQQENDHIWVHNCDFFYGDAGSDADQAKGDGALDTKTSTYITHSYNHFWDSGKANLQGMKDESTENYITYHHNWFDHSDSRHPRVRTCTVHVYNNFYDGVAKYGIGATSGCSIFSEANYFLNTKNPLLSSKQGTDALGDGTFSGESGGIIKSFGDVFNKSTAPISYANNKTSFDAYFASSRNEQVPSSAKTLSGGTTYNNFDTNSSLMYDYEAQSAAEAMETVKKYAGRVNGGDFKWAFSAADNTNYNVISGLKSALSSYKTSIVSIGGLSGVSTGSDGNGSTGGSSAGAGSGDNTGDDIVNPDTGSGDDSGSDNEGGNSGGNISYDSVAHNFTESGKDSDFFSINGNLSTSKGTVNYNGLTLTRCLKMESSTKISFTAASDGTLTLVFVESTPNAKVDGEKLKGEGGIITVELSAGSHEVTKGDTMNLFYMVFTPAKPDPAPHEHSFVDGKCECGETDPNYVPPHQHSFVDGKCECGEVDPNYNAPEDPKPEDPKPEDPKPEDPKPEDPKPEDPKPEDPKPEDPKPDPDPTPDTPEEPEAPEEKVGIAAFFEAIGMFFVAIFTFFINLFTGKL